MSLKMPPLVFDLDDAWIRRLSKRIVFLDIETSLVDAKVFRTGKQSVNAHQLTSTTKVLTVAGGSLYDLLTKGYEGMWSCSNHRATTFKKDPLNDAELLAAIWDVLDTAEVIVAHNASFDRGWLMGRFLELGWKLPSRFYTFCTYRNLTPFSMTSKKLNELSSNLIGTQKISTDFDLWMRCSRGDKKAFEAMEDYNLGDVYNTLFKVFLRTAYYNPLKSIDFTNPYTEIPNCRVDGSELEYAGSKINKKNGLSYSLYLNTRANIQYVDRYNTKSRKAGLGFVRPYV
jgi:hypothetical protein